MANATLQNVGTMLRHTDASLQRIRPTESEKPSIDTVQTKGTDMVGALNKLGAGTPPIPDTTEVVPTGEFLLKSKKVLLNAMQQIDPMITSDPPPAPSADLDALRSRINELHAAVMLAQGRNPPT